MAKIALALAFFSSAMLLILSYFYSLGLPEVVPYPDRMMCLPALLLGLVSWWRVRSFARSLPVMACLSIMLYGIFRVDPTEQGRALLVFAGVATALPISSLMAKTEGHRFCVKCFIASSLITLMVLAYLQGLSPSESRFGDLTLNGVLISDPNDLAIQLGIAAVLTISLMQKRLSRPTGVAHRTNYNLGWSLVLLVLSCGILLTTSRSGILSFFIVLGLFACSRNTRNAYRVLIFLTGTLVVLGIMCTDNRISSRFSDAENLAEFGGRLPIWETGWWILQSDRQYAISGVGTAGIEKVLAEYAWNDNGTRLGDDGIHRRASHNAYIEWVVSHGLLGVLLAAWLLVVVARRSLRLDQIDKSADRKILLAYCAVISIVAALYRTPFATPLCALLLAMLSGPFLAFWPRSAAMKKSSNPRKLSPRQATWRRLSQISPQLDTIR